MSYANTGVTAVIGLIVNPLLLHGLGVSAFGAWKAIQRFLDFGTAADGGASQSLKWVIAHRSTVVDEEKKRRDVGAAIVVALMWSPPMLAVAACVVTLLPHFVTGVPEADIPSLYLTGAILALNLGISSFAALPDAVLVGTNQGYRSMTVTTLVLIASNAAMIAATLMGYGIEGLAVCVVASTVVNGLVTLIVARRAVQWWGISRPERDDIRSLRHFSGWTLGWGFANRIMLATEAMLLSIFMGVASVAAYAFTSYVLQFGLSFCLMTTSALMPKLGALLGAGETADVNRLVRSTRELTLAVATICACLTIVLNKSFVTIWAGSSQFMGQTVNTLMAASFFQLALLRADGQLQDAGLKMRPKVLWGVATILVGVGVAALMFTVFRSVESIFVGLILGRLVGSISFPLMANRVVGQGAWPIRRFAAAVALIALSIVSVELIDAANLLRLVPFALAALLVFGATAWFVLLSSDTRRRIVRR